MPTCAELTAWSALITDPFRHVETDGMDGRDGWMRMFWVDPWAPDRPMTAPSMTSGVQTADYSVHLGPPRLPYRRAVSRGVYSNVNEVLASLRLLAAYYDAPNSLRLCPAAQGWYHAAGRVRALKALASWARSPGFVGVSAAAVGSMTYVLLRVFADPLVSKSGSRETEVAAAAVNVVVESKTSAFDAATWIPLWGLAVGGPSGGASVRTRVFAMKAIQAILRRGSLLPGQILAASSLADVLRQLVGTRAPNINPAERDFFLSEADATVGAAAAALAAAEIAAASGGVPPPTAPTVSATTWATIATAVIATGAVTTALILRRRRAVAQAR